MTKRPFDIRDWIANNWGLALGLVTAFLVATVWWLNQDVPRSPVQQTSSMPAHQIDERQAFIKQRLEDTRFGKDLLETRLRDIQLQVAVKDPDLAKSMEPHLSFYRDRLAPAVFEYSPSGPVLLASDSCRQEPCSLLVVAPLRQLVGQGTKGMWFPNQHALLLDQASDPNDAGLPYIVLHELYHALDPQIATQPPPTDLMTRQVPLTPETDATNFEVSILRASTNGRWETLISDTVEGLRGGLAPNFGTEQTPIAAIPPEIAKIFGDGVVIELEDLEGLTFLYHYELNRQLILTSTMTAADREHALDMIYVRVTQAIADPKINAPVYNSLMSWWPQGRR